MRWLTALLALLGTRLKRALDYAHDQGLTDELIAVALKWVKVAADKFVDKAERREYVVQILIHRGVPESLARLIVELAVQIYKEETRSR